MEYVAYWPTIIAGNIDLGINNAMCTNLAKYMFNETRELYFMIVVTTLEQLWYLLVYNDFNMSQCN